MDDESKEWYVEQLLSMPSNGYDRNSLERMSVVQLYKLYCERIDRQGMV
ncbi:hypothetical protein J22TS1_44000 [Siminovitchia terrae]|nr:hypothetical protein [Siminovitchia terrae]GIN93349.1 hypothetical protein J22TS1_44000 [Siminovitchia terrae]